MAVALATLLDFETEVESVIAGYLSTTLGLPAITSDTAASLVTPRVEVVSIVQDTPQHQYTIQAGTYAGRRLHDWARVRVDIRLVYAPNYAQTPGALRGKMRKALTDFAGIKTGLAVHNYLFLASDTYRAVWGGRNIVEDLKEENISSSVEAVFGLNPAQLESAT